jgi:hypothetical protein
MTGSLVQRLRRLEQTRKSASAFILWSDSDDPAAEPERIELCGLSHEECLDLLDGDAEERGQ